MKTNSLFARMKKLQATARTVPRRAVEENDEPSMRLSSAFIVVLLLHVVAVGGIYAFNSIKTHQGAFTTASTAPGATPAVAPDAATTKSTGAPAANSAANRTAPKVADKKPADPGAKPAARDTGQIYTVAKGDNPVVIAKRLGVSYDELLKLNRIEDPRKLQIGQKLHLPPKIKSN